MTIASVSVSDVCVDRDERMLEIGHHRDDWVIGACDWIHMTGR